MRPWGRAALFALFAGAFPAATACRSIAGIRSISYERAEASDVTAETDDSGDDGDAGDARPPDGSVCPPISPKTVATTASTLGYPSLSGGQLFYYDENTYQVVTCPTDGGPLQTVAPITDSVYAFPLANQYVVAGNRVLVSNTGTYDTDASAITMTGVIDSVPPGGGDASVFATANFPTWLVVDGTDLLWFNDTTSVSDVADPGSWLRCPLAGCPASEAGTPGTLWIANVGPVFQAFVGGGNLYLLAETFNASNPGTAALFECSLSAPCGALDGPNVRTVVGNIDESVMPALSFTTDGTYVYGTTAANGQIVRIDKNGSSSTLATNQTGPTSFYVDGPYLYWTTQTAQIVRVLSDGSGQPEVVACQQAGADNLITDSQYLYYTAQGLGQNFEIRKVLK